MAPVKAPYGTWKSPITADAISQGSISLADVVADRVTGDIYHLETRPAEQGRLVVIDDSTGKQILPAPYNARSKVQEYGGAAITAHDGTVYFPNFADGRGYAISPEREIVPITPDSAGLHRFAAFTPHPIHPTLLVAIIEDHTPPNNTPSTVRTTLGLIDKGTSTLLAKELVSGADFYAQPQLSPDGHHLAWTEWRHPDMPWTGAEVWLGDVQLSGQSSFQIANKRKIAGVGSTDGKRIGSVCAYNPTWVDNNTLLFTSDETGYQNLYIVDITTSGTLPGLLLPKAVPYDCSQPLHQLGWTTLAALTPSYVVNIMKRDGKDVLLLVDLSGPEAIELDCPYVVMNNLRAVGSTDFSFVFTAEKSDEAAAVVMGTVIPSQSSSRPQVVYKTIKSTANTSLTFPKSLVPHVQPYSLPLPPLPSASGPTDGPALVHVLYYPPTNPDYIGLDGEKPPCVVNAHGGPTAAAEPGYNSKIMYWTSRGWGWLDVNYRGSSGYGREYMCALASNWGITDIWDTYQAAKLLAERGTVDGRRCFVRGGSAGGYTVLCALTDDDEATRSFFLGGTSLYGISDVALLAVHTHKFESRYMDWLLGVTDYQDEDDRTRQLDSIGKERSPILKAKNIDRGCLFLQGSEDPVVPKAQSILFVQKIKELNPRANVEYVEYEGESHGFRKSTSIKDSMERERRFYASICGFAEPDAS